MSSILELYKEELGLYKRQLEINKLKIDILKNQLLVATFVEEKEEQTKEVEDELSNIKLEIKKCKDEVIERQKQEEFILQYSELYYYINGIEKPSDDIHDRVERYRRIKKKMYVHNKF